MEVFEEGFGWDYKILEMELDYFLSSICYLETHDEGGEIFSWGMLGIFSRWFLEPFGENFFWGTSPQPAALDKSGAGT